MHALSPEDVFARYATSPTVGLDTAAVERRARSGGKNVISPPKTQYWKKALNYVFGGFNFLMWIAFIVTIVSYCIDMHCLVRPLNTLSQLSYKPLGNPDPAAFNLGVAVLLVSKEQLYLQYYLSAHCTTTAPRHRRLCDVLRAR